MKTELYLRTLSKPVFGYLLAFAIGWYFGAANVRGLPVGIIYGVLMLVCIVYAVKGNLDKVFTLLPYILYGELYVRAYGRVLPYLVCQYFFIALLIILFAKKKGGYSIHSRAFLFLCIYFIMEALDMVRAADQNTTRGIIVQTLTLTMAALWGSFTIITPSLVNKLFTHIKYASLFLCGVMLTAQAGVEQFDIHSSYETTNGLAPVQVSAYLGLACVIFFWTIINGKGLNFNTLLNVALLAYVCVAMLLSFSRGGLYFLAILVVLYFFLNTNKARSWSVLLLLVPVVLAVYGYITDKTGGAIQERYTEHGTSGRDKLVELGFMLFSEEPVMGVGTGNFAYVVSARKLYYLSGAHNEFVRSAAEHGFLGIFFYWGYFAFLFLEISLRKGVQKEYAYYFLLLFTLMVVHNGLKISIQPLMILLATATPNFVRIKAKANVPASVQLTG
ncbi:O-antigen ligase family protein [Foetidibacter luteolus]|uniref:O-antigen ligase family protein n=1 Tax=Foetidibacter luteolus TaxID=2608880 RepID=UPI00129A7E7F|nr:O-antigen ligase family protein [Foetidibacter luteolus]